MSFQDAKYYVSETKQFVSYEEVMKSSLNWKESFNRLSAYGLMATNKMKR